MAGSWHHLEQETNTEDNILTKHRVLIVGVGSIGERHLRCFAATERAELSLCEINDELRQTVADRYHVRHGYSSLDEVLDDRDHRCDIAVIATPAHLHIPMATRLVQAGIHLLIEKPLSTSLEGIEALARLVGQHQVTACVAYVFRANPVLQSMREAIKSSRFGEPVDVVVTTGQNFPTYRPAYRDVYFAQRATGGGAIQDALTHMINACQWIVGPADRVMADASHQLLEGVEVEDTVHVIARHSGVLASYNLNLYQAPNEVVLQVVCQRGTARFEGHHRRWLSMTEPGGQWQVEFESEADRDGIFINQANAFLDSVEGKAPVLCTLAEGLQTLRVNLSVLQAADHPAWRQVAE
jgi:predicted dehydrogenase